jgi:hypothetical protein
MNDPMDENSVASKMTQRMGYQEVALVIPLSSLLSLLSLSLSPSLSSSLSPFLSCFLLLIPFRMVETFQKLYDSIPLIKVIEEKGERIPS